MVLMIALLAAAGRCLLDERREPLFTLEEHLENFASDAVFSAAIVLLALIVSGLVNPPARRAGVDPQRQVR